jgi:hypothetical protein
MNKFQKLSQINKDIEILETAGELRAAEIMHRKFIKEAQYMMPQMMPMMMMPQMMPMMNPMMMARYMAPAAAPRPVAAPSPIQQGTTPPGTQPPGSQVTPPTGPPANKEIKPPTVPPPAPNPQDNQRGYGNQQSKDQELQYLMNEKKRLEDMGANQPNSPYYQQYQTILQMIKRNQGGSVIKS